MGPVVAESLKVRSKLPGMWLKVVFGVMVALDL